MTRKPKRSVKYGNELDNPIVVDPRSADERRDGWKLSLDEIEQRVTHERQRKAGLLADFYGVDLRAPDGWRNLVMAMAGDLLPGFAVVDVPQPQGRPVGTGIIDRDILYHSIQELIETGAQTSIAGSARWLRANHPAFKNKSTAEGLRTLFIQERRRRRNELAMLTASMEAFIRARRSST